MKDLSVYVHIPFCSSRCHYCDFYFETGWSPAVLTSVLDGILAEAELLASRYSLPRLRSMYLGGGTPSVIPPAQLESFLRQLLDRLGVSGQRPLGELEMEANPESLSDGLLDALASAAAGRARGIRISLGIQSFSPENLRILGRRGTPRQAEEALNRMRRFAAESEVPASLNADLIYGLPGQEPAMFSQDLEHLIRHRPEGISLYQLSVEPRTLLEARITAGRLAAPKEEQQDELWQHALEELTSAGYRNYEVSNFALPGRESLHNFAYWRLRPYLGLGPGAVSTLPHPDNPFETIRTTNPDIFAYKKLENKYPGGRKTEHISPQQHFTELFITGLRTIAGVSLTQIKKSFGTPGLVAADELAELWRNYTIPHAKRIILQDQYRFTMDRLMDPVIEQSQIRDLAKEYRGIAR